MEIRSLKRMEKILNKCRERKVILQRKEHYCVLTEVDHEVIVVSICPIVLLFLIALGFKYEESG